MKPEMLRLNQFMLLMAGVLPPIVLVGRVPFVDHIYLATLVSFVCILIIPGWLLRLVMQRWIKFHHSDALPLSFLFSLGMLSPVAVMMMLFRAEFMWLAISIVIINTILFGLNHYHRHWPRFDSITVRLSPLMIATLLGTVGVITTGFSTASIRDEGDHWFYLQHINHYRTAELNPDLNPLVGISSSRTDVLRAVNGWWLLEAVVIDSTQQPTIDVYWRVLPPILMGMALLSFYALASVLFQRQRTVQFAVLAHMLFLYMSSNSHDWAGYAFFLRIIEDKYLMQFALLPAAFVLLLRYMTTRDKRWMIPVTLSLVALMFTHPLGPVLWGIVAIAVLIPKVFGALVYRGVVVVALVAAGIVLRLLFTSANTLSAVFAPQAFTPPDNTHIYLLSALDNLYIAHPHLIAHPIIFAGVLGLLPLLWQRRTPTTRFLVVTGVVVLVVLYSPLVTPLFGWLLNSPFLVWRAVWLMFPILIVVKVFEQRIARTTVTVLLLVLTLIALGLNRYIYDGWLNLQDYHRRIVSETERDLLSQLEQYLEPDSILLTEPKISTHVPAFAAQVQLLTFRNIGQVDQSIREEIARFYRAEHLDTAAVGFLQRRQIDAFVLPTYHDLLADITALPDDFRIMFENEAYVLVRVQIDDRMPALAEGHTAFLRGDWESARAYFLDAQHWLALANLALEQNDLDSATDYLSRITDSDSPWVMVAQAQLLEAGGQADRAIEIYQHAINLYPAHLRLNEFLGDVYMRRGAADSAIAAYARAVELYPSAGDTLIAQGDLYRSKGLDTAALNAYSRAISLEPDWLQHTHFPSLLETWGRNFTFDRRVDRVYSGLQGMGAIYEQQGQYDDAEQVYRNMIWLHPQQQDSYHGLFRVLRLQRQDDHIPAIIDQARRIFPNLAWPYLMLGEDALSNGETPRAIDLLTRALQLNWVEPPVYVLLERAYADPAANIELYTQAKLVAPWASWAELGLARNHILLNDQTAAVEHFTSAITLAPWDASGYNQLADFYFARSTPQQAVAVYERAIATNPAHAWPHAGLGRAYLRSDERALAEREFEQSIRLEPNNPDVYLTLGNMWRESGYIQEAIENYQHAIDLAPQQPQYQAALTSALAAQDERD